MPSQHCITSPGHYIKSRKRKNIEIGKEVLKLPLFSDDTYIPISFPLSLCIERANPKLLE